MFITVLAIVVAKAIMLALYLNGRRWRKAEALSQVVIARYQDALSEAAMTLSRTVVERDEARTRLADIASIVRRVPRRRWMRTARRIARASVVGGYDAPDYAHPR